MEWIIFLAMAGGVIWWISTKVSAISHDNQFHERTKAEIRDLQQGRAPNAPPPNAEESKRALNHMRLSNAFYLESFEQKNGNEQIAKLNSATREVLLARKLDPSITLTVDEKGTPLNETQDDMLAKYLYYESRIEFLDGERMETEAERWFDSERGKELGKKNMQKRASEQKLRAVDPAEKAVRYRPTNLTYLQHLVRVYDSVGRSADAKQVLDRALALNPDNIENLKLNSIRR